MQNPLDLLSARIDPASIAKVNVSGNYWPVYLRTSQNNDSQICLGIVLKVTHPELALHWKLVIPDTNQSGAVLVVWRDILAELEEALAAGDEESPTTAVVYGQRLPFQGESVERVLSNFAQIARVE